MYRRDMGTLVIAVLLLSIVVMTVSVINLSQDSTLIYKEKLENNYQNTAKWKIAITNITEGIATGNAINKFTPKHTNTSAWFHTSLYAPGDKMTYEITVKNFGNMNAKLKEVYKHEEGSNDAIVYTVQGINKEDELPAGEEKKFTVTVEYDGDKMFASKRDNPIYISLIYVQDK